jgi:hypothetical protein
MQQEREGMADDLHDLKGGSYLEWEQENVDVP